MTKAKYDTSYLKEKAITKYGSISNFNRAFQKKCGISAKTVSGNIYGWYKPKDDVMRMIASVLGVKYEEVSKCYNKTAVKVKNNSKTIKAEEKNTASESIVSNKKFVFNYNRLDEAVKKSGMSKNKICNIMGIADNTFSSWKQCGNPLRKNLERMCTLLSIDIDSLFDEVEEVVVPEESDTNEEKNDEIQIMPSEGNSILDHILEPIESKTLVSSLNFKTFSPTDNLYERMDILNENIILLGRLLAGNNIENIDSSEPDPIEKQDIEPEKESSEHKKPLAITPKKDKRVENSSKPILDTTNTANMSYEKYASKISSLIFTLTRKTGLTYNNTMHDYYIKFNKVYGVVYDQLKKDWFKDNGHHPTKTLQIIYHDKKLRQIFYNIIATDVSHIDTIDTKKTI